MPWFKVDDGFHSHPKVLALRTGPCEAEALAVWAKAGSWCMEHLTDGSIPLYVVETLLRRNATKGADELVRVRLWEQTADGYRFRKWAEYQPSKDTVVTKRAKTASKVASWRACNQVTQESRNQVTSDHVTLPPTRPDPTRPNESANALSGARAQSAHDARLSFDDVVTTFSTLRHAHCGAIFRPSQREHTKVNDLMDAANAAGTTREQRESSLKAAIRGYFAVTDDWCVWNDWPITGLHDFGKCLKRGRGIPEKRPEAPQTPRGSLDTERRRLVALRASSAWTQKSHEEQRAAIERLEAVERELAAMGKAS